MGEWRSLSSGGHTCWRSVVVQAHSRWAQPRCQGVACGHFWSRPRPRAIAPTGSGQCTTWSLCQTTLLSMLCAPGKQHIEELLQPPLWAKLYIFLSWPHSEGCCCQTCLGLAHWLTWSTALVSTGAPGRICFITVCHVCCHIVEISSGG
jgi:hypothetical protein